MILLVKNPRSRIKANVRMRIGSSLGASSRVHWTRALCHSGSKSAHFSISSVRFGIIAEGMMFIICAASAAQELMLAEKYNSADHSVSAGYLTPGFSYAPGICGFSTSGAAVSGWPDGARYGSSPSQRSQQETSGRNSAGHRQTLSTGYRVKRRG